MQTNTRRKDAQDIQRIIDALDAKGEFISAPSIAKQFGQTPANVHRILKMFNIDLKPYKAKFRAKAQMTRLKDSESMCAKTVSRLKDLDTIKLTLTQLVKKTGFKGTERELKALLIREQIPYKTKTWFAQYLKKVDTTNMTLRELFDECRLDERDISIATFRTRLYENAIPYKKVLNRRPWWLHLQGKAKTIPQEAIDGLHDYFKEHHVDTSAYTAKELYGYFDFNMPYQAFQHLLATQGIETRTLN